jgi:hypothetical protein
MDIFSALANPIKGLFEFSQEKLESTSEVILINPVLKRKLGPLAKGLAFSRVLIRIDAEVFEVFAFNPRIGEQEIIPKGIEYECLEDETISISLIPLIEIAIEITFKN